MFGNCDSSPERLLPCDKCIELGLENPLTTSEEDGLTKKLFRQCQGPAENRDLTITAPPNGRYPNGGYAVTLEVGQCPNFLTPVCQEDLDNNPDNFPKY